MSQNPEKQFEIIEEHIRGGCSVLYKVRPNDPHPDFPILALKAMLPDDSDPSSGQRFYMEYEFLRAYGHDNLIKVFDYYQEWNGQPAYLMEWINGQTWETFWKEKSIWENRALFLDLLKQICVVLDYVHRHHIVHRDLKPQNLLINKDNRLKLIDFGIMKVESLTLYTNRNTFMGSAYYVAPECLSGDEVTPAADIFSLGVILYDLITGTKPFRGHTLAETVYQRLVTTPKPPSQIKDLPVELDSIFESLLSKEPHLRPKTCKDVYDLFKDAFQRTKTEAALPDKPIDQLSKDHFLHSHFLETCLEKIMEKPILTIVGGQGTGKTTVAENLALKLVGDRVVLINCGPGLTQSDFIYMILSQVPIPQKTDHDLGPWLQIMGNALPQLNWRVTPYNHALHDSTIFSAFLHLLQEITKPICVIIEDLQLASETQFEFIKPLLIFSSKQQNPVIKVILTATESQKRYQGLFTEMRLTFPDVLTMTEYLTQTFDKARVPLSVTQELIKESGENVEAFISLVNEKREDQAFEIRDGVVSLHSAQSKEQEQALHGKPNELSDFSVEQLEHLKWIALAPNGLDLHILQSITGSDLDQLAKTLQLAAQQNLIEFRSSTTNGFIWQNAKVREYLRNQIPDLERKSRYSQIANAIEDASKAYLSYSPPLWLVLSQLYSRAGLDPQAAKFAMKYARYSFQNGNYEPIRLYLCPFVNQPELQHNQDFWNMLALAFREKDPNQAITFAKKALQLEENAQSLALNALLETSLENPQAAGRLLTQALAKDDWGPLDANMIPELAALTLRYPEMASFGERLSRHLQNKLKDRNDLVAQNLLLQTKAELSMLAPSHILALLEENQTDLVGQTAHRLAHLEILCSISSFKMKRAMLALQDQVQLSFNRKNKGSLYFRKKLFILLSFNCFEEVKKLISEYNGQSQENEELFSCGKLFQYITEFLVKEPSSADPHVLRSVVAELGSEKTAWAALMVSLFHLNKASIEIYEHMIEPLLPHISPFVSLQIPRFKLIQAYHRGQTHLDDHIQECKTFADRHGLILEQVRLHRLEQELRSKGRIKEPVKLKIPSKLIESQSFKHFTAQMGVFESK